MIFITLKFEGIQSHQLCKNKFSHSEDLIYSPDNQREVTLPKELKTSCSHLIFNHIDSMIKSQGLSGNIFLNIFLKAFVSLLRLPSLADFPVITLASVHAICQINLIWTKAVSEIISGLLQKVTILITVVQFYLWFNWTYSD